MKKKRGGEKKSSVMRVREKRSWLRKGRIGRNKSYGVKMEER